MGNRIQEEPLSLETLIRETEGVDDGALVVFSGNVRAIDGGVEVAALDYDVHRPMAEEAIRRIEDEILKLDGVLSCRIVHRIGYVPARVSRVCMSSCEGGTARRPSRRPAKGSSESRRRSRSGRRMCTPMGVGGPGPAIRGHPLV